MRYVVDNGVLILMDGEVLIGTFFYDYIFHRMKYGYWNYGGSYWIILE